LIIYVGNLSLEVTAEELRQEFAIFGDVISVDIMSDRYIGSGQPRGYGFVEMAARSAGALAVANLQGKMLKTRAISVVEALPLSAKASLVPGGKISRPGNHKIRQRKY